MHYDVIIIGMGLSGLMAAKTAAESGKKVLIIGKGTGSLCLFSCAIDVLGCLPVGQNVKDGLSRWIQDYPDHPYSKAGQKGIMDGLSSFQSLFLPPYSFRPMGKGNCLSPTGAGTLRPTYLVPTTLAGGLDLREGESLIVGFSGFKDFYASNVAHGLNCRGITLPLRDASFGEITAAALARLMEDESFRLRISKEIREQLRGESKVGLPAVLGTHRVVQVTQDLEQRIGVQVFEIPTLPPSIPGQRIFHAFRKSLIQKGVTFLAGFPVSEAQVVKGRCNGISISHPPVTTLYTADKYFLATGRFLGGGLTANMEKITETIFGLPVSQPLSRQAWHERSFSQSHPIHRVGILIDPTFRPVDENGRVILENVWVAGSILAHHNCIEEQSREGIEIATGYMATKEALKI